MLYVKRLSWLKVAHLKTQYFNDVAASLKACMSNKNIGAGGKKKKLKEGS